VRAPLLCIAPPPLKKKLNRSSRASRTHTCHTHEHRSQWRESLATRPGSRRRKGRCNGAGDTEDVLERPNPLSA
jgi:hypothetical protein